MANFGLDCWLTQWDGEPSLYMGSWQIAGSFPLCVVEGPNPAQGRREHTTGSMYITKCDTVGEPVGSSSQS